MEYSTDFIKELEQLSYHVNNSRIIHRPLNWRSIEKYENKKTGFLGEAFVNEKGQKVIVFAGTNPLSVRDDWNDFQILKKRQVPNQAEDAYQAYQKFKNRYDEGEDVIVVGYSLGGALSQIVCNETGARGINFAPLGVSDIVKSNHTSQIINFGNENDIFYRGTFDELLGTKYVIPDDDRSVYAGKGIETHMPNKIGDISKAIRYEDRYQYAQDNSYILNGYINRNYYDDSLFDISNKVIYNSGDLNLDKLNSDEINLMLSQYEENGQIFPSKEDMERRVRFGELLYVENYTRSDGTKVSGYYRRYPQR
ncbi:DUF2974 domain-containing protein [bacterium]|nr:DUF2974 domain-containing protein [bacterium]